MVTCIINEKEVIKTLSLLSNTVDAKVISKEKIFVTITQVENPTPMFTR